MVVAVVLVVVVDWSKVLQLGGVREKEVRYVNLSKRVLRKLMAAIYLSVTSMIAFQLLDIFVLMFALETMEKILMLHDVIRGSIHCSEWVFWMHHLLNRIKGRCRV